MSVHVHVLYCYVCTYIYTLHAYIMPHTLCSQLGAVLHIIMYMYMYVPLLACWDVLLLGSPILTVRDKRDLWKSNRHWKLLNYACTHVCTGTGLTTCTLTFSGVWFCGVDLGEKGEGWRCESVGSAGGGWWGVQGWRWCWWPGDGGHEE